MQADWEIEDTRHEIMLTQRILLFKAFPRLFSITIVCLTISLKRENDTQNWFKQLPVNIITKLPRTYLKLLIHCFAETHIVILFFSSDNFILLSISLFCLLFIHCIDEYSKNVLYLYSGNKYFRFMLYIYIYIICVKGVVI